MHFSLQDPSETISQSAIVLCDTEVCRWNIDREGNIEDSIIKYEINIRSRLPELSILILIPGEKKKKKRGGSGGEVNKPRKYL